jgi:hypothetical protein
MIIKFDPATERWQVRAEIKGRLFFGSFEYFYQIHDALRRWKKEVL